MNLEKIVDFIIKTVQVETFGFQYILSYEHIETDLNIKLDHTIIKQVKRLLCEREEVADVEINDEAFDVVLYTDYSPNYIDDDEDEEDW